MRLMDAAPPTLYVDDYHVIEEIRDLTQLRRGDHCMCVGVLSALAPWLCGPVPRGRVATVR